MRKPYVILKCATSLDGCLDDVSSERLILSNQADFERVDQVRAECDAILVGANTVRKDNPKLTLKSEQLKKKRIAQGKSAEPLKVTYTGSGLLDPTSNFFTTGTGLKSVFCSGGVWARLLEKLANSAEVVAWEGALRPGWILEQLVARGVQRLMIEGGSQTNTLFLKENLVDELQVSIAPFFVAEKEAPRIVFDGLLLQKVRQRMTLSNVEQVGDMALLVYKLEGSVEM